MTEEVTFILNLNVHGHTRLAATLQPREGLSSICPALSLAGPRASLERFAEPLLGKNPFLPRSSPLGSFYSGRTACYRSHLRDLGSAPRKQAVLQWKEPRFLGRRRVLPLAQLAGCPHGPSRERQQRWGLEEAVKRGCGAGGLR